MNEVVSTVTSKGQVTIPVEVRRYLGLHQGDKLSFVITDNGAVEMRVSRYPTVASLRGRSASLPELLSFDEMRDAAREERLAKKYRPSR